jgi:hypothetical protein
MNRPNITPYLKDIDEEIEQLRETIARCKVRIVDLEDMRVLMMQREETRARLNGHASPFGAIEGGQIVVRDPAAMYAQQVGAAALATAPPQAIAGPIEDPEARKREMKRIANAKYNAKRKAREGKEAIPPPGAPLKPDSSQSRVRALLRANPQRVFDVDTVMDRLGFEGPKRRQQVHQSLYQLRLEGSVERLDKGTYQFKPEARP